MISNFENLRENMNYLNKISELLENYRGHDQTLALVQYASEVLAGLTKNQVKQKRLLTIYSQFSNARTVFRLIDDFSMLNYSLFYGLGKHVSLLHFSNL